MAWISVEDDPSRAVRREKPYVVSGNPDEVIRELLAFSAAGARHFQVRFMDYPETAGMERFVEKVMPRLIEEGATR